MHVAVAVTDPTALAPEPFASDHDPITLGSDDTEPAE